METDGFLDPLASWSRLLVEFQAKEIPTSIQKGLLGEQQLKLFFDLHTQIYTTQFPKHTSASHNPSPGVTQLLKTLVHCRQKPRYFLALTRRREAGSQAILGDTTTGPDKQRMDA